MTIVGYEFVRERLKLPAFPVADPARVGAYSSVQRLPDGSLGVPGPVAPGSDGVLEHLLFALRYEGTNLQVLAHAMRRVAAHEMAQAVAKTPTGAFVRKAAFLWEHFNGRQLEGQWKAGGPYVPMFSPDDYFVGTSRRDARWRVDFNGLGSLDWCVTVRRTPAILELLGKQLLAQAREFAQSIGPEMLDRALEWAYLSETQSSYAIENESPSEDKARTFMGLLRQAHERRELSEAYLVELQGSVVSNAYDRAFSFRTEQNWLQGPMRGAAGVTYVPPPPRDVEALMGCLTGLANDPPKGLDPLVTAAVVSFGLVYIHPFMDGNGRLSRFLLHHCLCRSGLLPDGFVLPVSMAMKRHEDDYLRALKAFSQPSRELWSIRWIDDGRYEMALKPGAETIYRYWDATPCVEFSVRMTQIALDHDLRRETRFLAGYDRVERATNARFDLRGSDLATLILSCFDNHGKVSKHRRKQLEQRVPEAVFDFLEQQVGDELDRVAEAGRSDAGQPAPAGPGEPAADMRSENSTPGDATGRDRQR